MSVLRALRGREFKAAQYHDIGSFDKTHRQTIKVFTLINNAINIIIH